MKSCIFIITAIIIIPMCNAYAVLTPEEVIQPSSCYVQCATDEFGCSSFSYSNCSDYACETCKDAQLKKESNNYGIDVITSRHYDVQCNFSKCTASCECKSTSFYACSVGYYGTATSASAGCTPCPDNATCEGGNGSTFKCKATYYKNGNVCKRCPSSKDGGLGEGEAWGSSSVGATAITDCFIPQDIEICDDTGCFDTVGDCYWKN